MKMGKSTLRNMTDHSDIFIARSVGIVAVASGFILGMHGLDHPDTIWLNTALGLIVTGMLAQAYALVRSITRAKQKNKDKENS